MATLSLTDAQIYAAGYDFTSDSNQVSLSWSADDLDSTTFGSSGYRSRIAGLFDISGNVSGFWQSDTTDAVDPQVFDNIGSLDRVFTVSPTGDDGEIAYTFRGSQFSYDLLGTIGEIVPFSFDASGTNGAGVVRGQMLFPKADVSGASNGTGQNLGAVAADEHLYTSIHVFSAGTTADVIVESDDDSGFPSPTTRSTTTVTSQGGTWVARVSGAITDDHWRVRFANVTGTFNLAVVVGIAS